MKKLVLAAVLAAAASHASAGGYVEPVMEPVIVEEDTASTNAGWVIPVLLLALVAAAVSN